MAVRVISQSELDLLWARNHMAEKRADGVLVEIIAHSTGAGNLAFSGGVSVIVKLLTEGGHHIGTVHEVRMPDGSAPHSHPKDYTLRDCSRVRA